MKLLIKLAAVMTCALSLSSMNAYADETAKTESAGSGEVAESPSTAIRAADISGVAGTAIVSGGIIGAVVILTNTTGSN